MSDGTNNYPPVLNSTEEVVARKRSLAAALSEVKNRQVSRDDVVVDMKEAEHARLELLAEEVRPLFDDLPAGNDQFEFAITNGRPPRLWIDMTTHVSMGHDRRSYRFLKDTRAGRVVLAESNNLKVVADSISNYVAERVLEREQILEGEWSSLRLVEATAVGNERDRKKAIWLNLFWFAIGFGTSLGAMYFWINYQSAFEPLFSMVK